MSARLQFKLWSVLIPTATGVLKLPFEQLRPEDRQPSKCDRGVLTQASLAPRWTLSQVLCSSDEEGAKVLGREGWREPGPTPPGSGRHRERHGSGCGAAWRRRRLSRRRRVCGTRLGPEGRTGVPGRGKGLWETPGASSGQGSLWGPARSHGAERGARDPSPGLGLGLRLCTVESLGMC